MGVLISYCQVLSFSLGTWFYWIRLHHCPEEAAVDESSSSVWPLHHPSLSIKNTPWSVWPCVDYKRRTTSFTCHNNLGCCKQSSRILLDFGSQDCHLHQKHSERFQEKLTIQGLTFNPDCVSHKTVGGHFISGTAQKVPPAKRQKLEKHFARKYQTFIDVTVPGNLHGVHKTSSFLQNLRVLVVAIMGLEKRLVVLPFPDRPLNAKCRPFQGDASMLSGVSKACLYLEDLWVKEGQDTIVKMFVAHNIDPLAFNSL